MPVKSGDTAHIEDSTYYQIYNSCGVEFFADDSSEANEYINSLMVAPSCGMINGKLSVSATTKKIH